jgi:hypothetical protein
LLLLLVIRPYDNSPSVKIIEKFISIEISINTFFHYISIFCPIYHYFDDPQYGAIFFFG